MKIIILLSILAIPSLSNSFSAADNSSAQTDSFASQQGITHYGMPIEEIKKSYKQQDATLEVVYSKMLSDDSMDNYVKRFYDEFLRQLETWLYANTLPVQNMKIVISNCKFCTIGYCKKKNVKEVSLVSYRDDKKDKEIAFKHADIIDTSKYENSARSALTLFLDN
jgi:hypothetical protein